MKKVIMLSLVTVLLSVASFAQTTFTWNGGGGDGLWTTTANWTKVGVSTSTYPGQNAAQNDQAIIITAVTVTLDASVITNSVTDLQVNGTGVLDMGANSLTLTGASANISGTGTINISTGTLTVGGTVSSVTIVASGAATFSIAGTGTAFDPASFTASASTVNLSGTNQTISNSITYYNLTMSGAGTKTAAGALTISHDVSLAGVTTIFNDGNASHSVGGTWGYSGGAPTSANYVGSGTVTFTGSTTFSQNGVFNNITLSGGVKLRSGGIWTISGNLLVTNGGILQTTANAAINITGNWQVDSDGSQYTASNGTVTFNSNSAQSITMASGSYFYTVALSTPSGSSTKTALTALDVRYSFTINTNTTFNPGNFTHIFGTSNGIFTLDGSITSGTTSTFDLRGTVANSLTYSVAGPVSLPVDVLITGGYQVANNKTFNVGGNVTVSGYLNLGTGASFNSNGTGKSFTISGTGNRLYLRGGSFPAGFSSYSISTTSTTRYDQANGTTIFSTVLDESATPVTIQYGNVVLDGGVTKSANGNLTINGSLNISATTTLDLAGYNLVIGTSFAAGTLLTLNTTGVLTTSVASGTVTVNSTDVAHTIGAGVYTLYNLTLTNNSLTTSRNLTISSNMTVSGNLLIDNPAGSSSIIFSVIMGSNATPRSFSATGGSNVATMNSYTNLTQYQTTTAFGTSFNEFETHTLDALSTITFAASTDQTIPVLNGSYGAITINGGGTKSFANDMVINGTLNINNVVQTVTDNGYNITINGGLYKVGNNPVLNLTGTMTFEGGTQQISFSGTSSTLNNVVFGGVGTKTLLTALTVGGNLTITQDAVVSTALGVTFSGETWDNGSGGLFQQTAGTTTFSGTTAGSHQYLNNPGSDDNSFSYFFALTLNNGTDTLVLQSDIDVNSTLTFTINSGNLDATNQTIRIGTNWTRATGTSFLNTGSTVVFDGTSTQTITALSLPFNNVTFRNAGPKSMSGGNTPLIANGNVSIEGGATFNPGTAATHTVAGNWVNAGTYSQTGTLTFNGADQTLEGTFGSVTFGGTGTKTLTGSISLAGALIINDGVTLDVSSSNYAISLTGAWTNSGTGVFVPHSGSVTFTGNSRTITPGANKSFYDLNVNMTSGYTLTQAASNALSVQNDLNIIQGTFSSGANNITIGGSFINAGSFAHNTASTITFTATTGTKTITTNGSNILGPVVFATGAAAIYQLGDNYTTNNAASNITLNASSGTVKLNGKAMNLTISSTATINIAGGTFHVDSASVLSMPTNGVINNTGGTLRIVGVSGDVATIQGTTTGYTITQSGASSVIAANYYLIQELSGNGITLSNGSIDATDNFSNGTFNDGRIATQYLNISALTLNTDINANAIVFNSGATYNITRTTVNGTGMFIVNDATGSLSGESFDNDLGSGATDGVNWTYVGGVTFDNDGGDFDWNNGLNWSSNSVPGPSDYVILDHTNVAGVYTVNISAANAECGNIVIGPGGGNLITLALSGNFDLDVNGDLNINTNSELTQANSGSTITVGGAWSNAGTYTANSSSVTFDGASVNKSISSSGSGNFYDIIINGNGSSYTLGTNLTIAHNFTLTDGTLDVTASLYTLGVAGDWSVSGTFTPRTSTVTFNGASQNISGGSFYNFTTSGSGTKTIASNLDINGNVTIGAGTTLDGGTYTLYVGASTATVWVNNSGTGAFTQTGAGNVTFDGGNITLDNGAFATTFNHLNFAGTGTKTFGGAGSTINGDMSIAAGNITVNLASVSLNFAGTNTLSILGNSTLQVRQTNLPASLENLSLNSASTVLYISDAAQNIFPGTYGNLQIQRITGGQTPTKTLLGTTIVLGTLTLNDAEVRLDLGGQYLTLSGGLTIPTNPANFTTTGSTIEFNGGNITIDADLLTVNNLILSGTGTKTLAANLAVNGNLQVASGVTLTAGAFVITGTGGGTFTLNSTATFNTAQNGATPLPISFGAYAFNTTSTINYNSNTGSQTIINSVTYGNLTLTNGNGTKTAGGNLDINGTFTVGANVVFEAGSNTYNIAGDMLTYSTATITPQTSTFIFDGVTQAIGVTNVNSAATVPFNNLTVSSSGTLTLSSTAGDVVSVAGNFVVGGSSTVTTARNFSVTGSFTNNNSFTQTAGTLTFDGGNQTIALGSVNSFNNLLFTTTAGALRTKTFTTNGATINGTVTLGVNGDLTNIVDWVTGNGLSHTLVGAVTINTNNVWTATGSDLTFNGGNIQLPTQTTLTANNVTFGGTGTKTLNGALSVNTLTINNGVTLNTNGAGNYGITVTGNWTNNGTFTTNASTVAFESSDAVAKTIQSNGSAFYNVTFNQSQTSARTYTLTSATTTINQNLTIGTNATLDLNNNALVAGINATASTISVTGQLVIDNGAFLRFNNTAAGGSLTVNSGGTLTVLGTSSSSVGTITRSAGANRTSVTILSGGTLAAKYYLFEYLVDAGLVMNAGAVLDNTNNLSNGTWSNISTNASARYLQIDNNVGAQNIDNVTFNYTGTPTTQINVARTTGATGAITFGGTIDGGLAGLNASANSIYESDPDGTMSWPLSTAKTWTGTTSTDWNIASNWSPSGVPDNTIDVTIPDVANDPKITTANADVKSLIITTGTLVLENGFDLTILQDITIGTGASAAILSVTNNTNTITVGGSWTRGTNGTFGNGSSTVYFNGSTGTKTIDNRGSSFYNIEFTDAAVFNIANTGAVIDINGSLTIGATSTVTMTINNYNMTLAGDFINNGAFNPTSSGVVGTVTLDGAAQNITGGNFYNLTVSGSGTKTTTNATTITTGTLTVNSTLTAGAAFDINGPVSIAAAGVFNDGGFSHTFSGATWTNANTTNGFSGTGTLTMDGAGQTINTSQFYNLTFAGTGTKTLGGNLTVNGDLVADVTITAVNLVTYQITGQASKSFTFNAPNLYVRGASNFPVGFGTFAISSASTTNYDAAFDQTIDGNITYGPLVLANASTKTLSDEIVVIGSITFGAATLDVSASNYSISLTGNWNNNSTGSFTSRLGDVIFSGSAAQTINNGNSGTKTFYKITVSNTGGGTVTVNNANNAECTNNLSVTDGYFSPNGFTMTVGGSLTATGTGGFVQSGTFVLNATSGTKNISTNVATVATSGFVNMTINATGVTYTAQDNLLFTNNFTVTAGTFDGNGKYITIGDADGGTETGSITGTYIVGAGGTLAIGNATTFTVNSGGEIRIVGTGVSPVTVTRTGAGRYGFQVNGTIQANYVTFEYMNSNGINIGTTATVHATNNFSNSTFTNGVAGGVLLVLDHATAGFTITDISFPSNPGGGAYNVRRSAASGVIVFNPSTGAFTGESFDNDSNNLLSWPTPVTLTWRADAPTSDWFTATNWTPSSGGNIIPDTTTNVVIISSVNSPLINTSGAKTNNLTITSGTLTINTGDDGTATDLKIFGDATFNGGSLVVTASVDKIQAGGNWTKAAPATFTNGSSTVTFNAVSGSKTINNGTASFYNVVLNTPATYSLAANTTVSNDFTITAGTLDVSATLYNLTVGGNWSNSGTFTSRTGTVIFNQTGAVTKTINAGTSAFNNITFNLGASTIYQLVTNNLTTKANTTISAGTLELNGKTFNHGDGAGVDALSVTGILKVNANAFLLMGASSTLTVNSGGTFSLLGTSTSALASIGRQSAGTYSFTISSGGTIIARYYLVEYTDASGVLLNAGALIDATNYFQDGTFSNGAAAGTYLTLSNTLGGQTVTGVTFNSGPTYNVTRANSLTGSITFEDSQGALAGEANDNDVNNQVNFTSTVPETYWLASPVSSEWNNPSNWDNGVPTTGTNAYINTTSTNPIISTASAFTKNLTIANGRTLTVQGGQNLTINGDITITGTLTHSGVASTIAVAGSWTKTGTFTPGNSEVEFTAASGTKVITNGATAFKNVHINGAGTFSPAANITISGNLTLSAGTFDVTASNYSVLLGGNWVNSGGTFNGRAGTVTLNGTSTQSINTGGTGAGKTFYNLTVSKASGTADFVTNNVKIDNNFSITSGTMDGGSVTISVLGNWNNSGGTFTPSTSTVSFESTGSRTLSANTSAFNNLTVNKTSGGSISLSSNITVNGNLTVTAGTLFSNSKAINFGDAGSDVSSVASGATLDIDAGSFLRLYGGTSNTITGTLKLVGTNGSNLATLTRNTTGNYSVTIDGTLYARFAVIEYTGTNGIVFGTTGTVDATDNMVSTTFQNGNGNAYLTLNSNTSFDLASTSTTGLTFGSGPTYNVQKTSGSSSNRIYNYKGALGGARYENDNGSAPRGNIRWLFDETQASLTNGNTYTFGNDFVLQLTAGGPLTSVRVILNDSTYNHIPNSVARYYTVTSTGSATVDVTQYWGVSDLNGQTADITLNNWRRVGTVNTPFASNTVNAGSRFATTNGVTSVNGVWFLSNAVNDGSLPVVLDESSIQLTSSRKGVNIKWATESETGNAMWIIERATVSENGLSEYSVVKKMDGAGTVTTRSEYKILDSNVDVNFTYKYRLVDIDYAGQRHVTELRSIEHTAPSEFSLGNNYPNPFNPSTTIPLDVVKEQMVTLKIYNILGQEVRVLKNEVMKPGYYDIVWNGADESGKIMASGQYFVRVVTDGFVKNQKMILIK